jgi:hypothetical protein
MTSFLTLRDLCIVILSRFGVIALARENALEPNELLVPKRAGTISITSSKTHQQPYSRTMASTGSESPSKSKRSRAEMEADDHPMAPAAQTNDGKVF